MGTPTADEEERMRKAIEEVRNKRFSSIYAAAKKWCVNYDIMRGRMKGRKPNSSRGGRNKRLDDAEEATLVLYCQRLIKLGDNPGRKDIEAAANSILRAAGKRKVSKPWLTRWLNNHKALLKPRISKPLAAERKAAHEEEDILAHFRKFETTVKEYHIKKRNCWNFDETGWRIGILNGRLVFTFPDVSAVYIEDPDTRESLTSIEACNTAGDYAPGMLILPGQELQEKFFDNDINDEVTFATNRETGSGFTNDQLAIDWLEAFEEATRPGQKTRTGKVIYNGEWRMLIFDGHGSHLTIEFMAYCWDHKIVPFKLPPHSTHLLQPMDVGFFEPMKQNHQTILAKQVRFGGPEPYTKMDFLDAYNRVAVRTAKKSTIIHAWAKAGLWPLDPLRVITSIEKMEPPTNRYYDPVDEIIKRMATPEPQEINWSSAVTPEQSISAVQQYSEYIDKRLTGAIDGTIPLSPTVQRVIDKRNKAQNIIVYTGVLSTEELTKRKAEKARRKRHKKEGGNRRVKTDHRVIKKSDALLRFAKRNEYLQQQKNLRLIEYQKKLDKAVDYRWGVTARAATRWS